MKGLILGLLMLVTTTVIGAEDTVIVYDCEGEQLVVAEDRDTSTFIAMAGGVVFNFDRKSVVPDTKVPLFMFKTPSGRFRLGFTPTTPHLVVVDNTSEEIITNTTCIKYNKGA